MKIGFAFCFTTIVLLSGCTRQPTSAQQPVERFTEPPAQMMADRAAGLATIKAAMAQSDYPRALAVMNDWAERHPGDFDFQQIKPLTYALMGDDAGWERARAGLLADWARMGGSVPPAPSRGFTIDAFKHGGDTVLVDQCYERAGRFGVLYKFTVLGANAQPTSFFTVESSDADNQVARELGRPAQAVSLDFNRPGRHETVALMQGLPPYGALRQRVLAYMNDPRPQSASSTGIPGLANYGCEVARRS